MSKENVSATIMNEFKGVVNKHLGNGSNDISIVTGAIYPTGIDISSYGNLSKNDNITANGNTLFDIADITKTFTALLLADMVEKGKVNLNDTIGVYLPSNVGVPEYNGQKITLENLAMHTSGLPDLPPGFALNQSYSAQQVYDALSNTTLISRPGSIVNYSDIGMALLGHGLSLKANKSFEQSVDESILKVLGMDSTGINLTNYTKPQLAKGHLAGEEINLESLSEITQPFGSMYSTTKDLLKYLSANMDLIHTKLTLPMQDTHLIRQTFSTSNLTTNQTMPLTTFVGLGWFTTTDFNSSVVWQSGSIDGYTSFIGFNPDKKIGLVVLCSCDDSDVPLSEMVKIGITYLLKPVINNNAEGNSAGGEAIAGEVGAGGSCFALIIGDGCGGSTGSSEPRGGAGGSGDEMDGRDNYTDTFMDNTYR